MPSLEPDAIERFMKRVKSAAQSNSKDIRLPTNEAQELCASIGELLARLARPEVSNQQDVIFISLDGGSLD